MIGLYGYEDMDMSKRGRRNRRGVDELDRMDMRGVDRMGMGGYNINMYNPMGVNDAPYMQNNRIGQQDYDIYSAEVIRHMEKKTIRGKTSREYKKESREYKKESRTNNTKKYAGTTK